MSKLVGDIVIDAKVSAPQYAGNVIASALAVIAGSIVFALGMLRLGFVVEFIPLPAIAAFMTGSALNIAMGQIPGMMGITGFSTRDATYLVLINTLKGLGRTTLDAAMGIPALALLYLIRSTCNFCARRWPSRQKMFFFIATLRTAFTILLFTMISWLVNKDRRANPAFKILKDVPKGFQNMGVPVINSTIVGTFTSNIPVTVIVLLIEHIAISKSFGRVNNYVINPSQELIAIGITNIFGAFFGAYPATGSFSRTAIKSKAGVRTPLAGVITGVLVLLAIYLLTAVFFYIPNASLAAVIIHAVGDLITPPKTLFQFWRISPLEVVIYFAGVIVTVFTTIEIGIYVTVGVSGAVLLWRVAKAQGEFLGRLSVRPLDGGNASNVYLPLDREDGTNPDIPVEQPKPGVFIFRFASSFLYPNATHATDRLVDYIMAVTKRTNVETYGKLGDRPWNMPGPRHIDPLAVVQDQRPTLRAIIIDFSRVHNIDVSSTQVLIDIRNQLDRHASPERVDWHFVNVYSPWIRRALISGGFGRISDGSKAVFSVANVGNNIGGSGDGRENLEKVRTQNRIDEEIAQEGAQPTATTAQGSRVPVLSTDYPAFHLTIDEALDAVEHNYDRIPSSLGSSVKDVTSDSPSPAEEYAADKKTTGRVTIADPREVKQ